MAFSCYMRISGVVGESSDEQHRQWIELIGYHHNIKREYDVLDSSNVRRDRRHSPFTVQKRVDNASPILMRSLCEGRTHDITLHICRAQSDGSVQPYLYYEFKECVLLSIDYAASESTDLPMEKIVFGYKEIRYQYDWWDHATGRMQGSTEYVDDVRR